MMRRIIHFTILTAVLLPVAACVRQLDPAPEDSAQHAVTLTLDGGVQPYDAESGTKAAAALSWKAGDIIYVRTETSSGATTSYAQCNADGSWTFNYTGSLGASSQVRCCFIDRPRGTDAYQVSLSYHSAIYEDPSATLTISGSNATLSTYLKPKTGRISFHGELKAIKVTGLSWYSAFDLQSFSFTQTGNAYVSSFQTGASNYFYGFFDEENSARELFITTDNLIFKRSFGAQVLRAGASGYVDVPTHDSYAGWTLTNEEELIRYQPIQFEDDNFKAWLIQQGYDRDGDGEISYAEGERVTEIVNDGNNSVTSLKGIEYFPNLNRLRWTGSYYWGYGRTSEGQITAVDVSGNSKLVELVLDNNQLTALDVSQNSRLTRLSFVGNKVTASGFKGIGSLKDLHCEYNPMGQLDLSGFTSLEELHCDECGLSSLNVSACQKLRVIYASNNQLTSLGISSLGDLLILNVGDNQLTTLDISACPLLTDLNIESNAGITTLDLRNSPILSHLSFGYTGITSIDLSPCPNLSYIWCWGCNLSSLDVSTLSKLCDLFCGDCHLTSLDVSNNTELTALACSYNELGSVTGLSGCSQLIRLEINQAGLHELDLRSFPNLEELYCSENDFSAAGLDLYANSKLRALYCADCYLPALDVSANLKLESLSCYSNQLTVLDVYANSNLNFLNASGNPLLESIYVRTGHAFPSGLYYDGGTEIVYQD